MHRLMHSDAQGHECMAPGMARELLASAIDKGQVDGGCGGGSGVTAISSPDPVGPSFLQVLPSHEVRQGERPRAVRAMFRASISTDFLYSVLLN